MKLLLERVDESCVRHVLGELIDEMEKAVEERRKRSAKVI